MKFIRQMRESYLARARVGWARMGSRLEERIRATSPRKTGNMQRRTRVTPQGEFRLRTLVDTEYASFLREGTRAHGPVNAPFLVFKIDNKWIRTKRVRGITPRPWYDNALAERTKLFEEERAKLP